MSIYNITLITMTALAVVVFVALFSLEPDTVF